MNPYDRRDEGNAIFSFRLDASTGKLTALGAFEAPEISRADQARFDPDHVSRSFARPVQGPRHLVFHPTLPLVYVTNEQGNSVSTWRFDRGTGSLEHTDVISTVPVRTSHCRDVCPLPRFGTVLHATRFLRVMFNNTSY
jgi:6-phosphogluconolactonase